MEMRKWEKQQQQLQQAQTQGTTAAGAPQKKPVLVICSICRRKFGTEEQLYLHEKNSELHK